MREIFPRSGPQLVVWNSNFGNQIKLAGPGLGLSTTDIAETQQMCQNLVDSINLADQKKKDARAAAQAARRQRKTTLASLRKTIARIRTSPAWTSAQAQTLGVQTTAQPGPVLESHKPSLRVQKTAGRVELLFARKQMDGVNVYTRKKGESAWRLLSRVRYSPAVDTTPPATPGVPEVREYRILALYKDQEVGQPSDIVSTIVGD